MEAVFGGVRAPSTFGSFLRSFTWSNVRQFDAVHRGLLAELAWRAPLLPGPVRLRGGSAGSARGAASLAAEAIGAEVPPETVGGFRVRAAGAGRGYLREVLPGIGCVLRPESWSARPWIWGRAQPERRYHRRRFVYLL